METFDDLDSGFSANIDCLFARNDETYRTESVSEIVHGSL